MKGLKAVKAQSRQSAFLKSSELGLAPNPSPAGECAPLQVLGGRDTLAVERGVGTRVPILSREHTLWYSLYISTYFVGEGDQEGKERGKE